MRLHGSVRQPKEEKWVCYQCGKVPAERRKEGQPRFRRESFKSKRALEKHTRQRHT